MTGQADKQRLPEIFLLRGEETFGPFDEERIRGMLRQGLLAPTDRCLPEGEERPRLLGEVLGMPGPGRRAAAGHKNPRDFEPHSVDSGGKESGLPVGGVISSFEPIASVNHSKGAENSNDSNTPQKGALLYYGNPSFLSFSRTLLAGAAILVTGIYFSSKSSWFLLAGLVGFALPYFYVLAMRACHVYVVTKKRAEIIYGIFSKSSCEVKIADIRAINVKTRGLMGLMGIGDVEFCSAGSEGVEVVFASIWKPHRVKTLVRKLQDLENE